MRRRAVSLWLVSCCLACGGRSESVAGASQDPAADRDRLAQHKALVRRWIEDGFNTKNLNVLDEIVAENLVVNGSPIGREGLRQSMSRHLTAFPDLRVTITDVVAEGDQVAIWYTAEGTQLGVFDGMDPTGERVSWTGVDLVSVAGGRIVEARFLSDALGLLRQLEAAARPSPSP